MPDYLPIGALAGEPGTVGDGNTAGTVDGDTTGDGKVTDPTVAISSNL